MQTVGSMRQVKITDKTGNLVTVAMEHFYKIGMQMRNTETSLLQKLGQKLKLR